MWSAANLQTKFLLITVPLILFSTIGFTAAFTVSAERSARKSLEQRMEKVAEIQAKSIAGPLWFINYRQLDLVLNAMTNDPDFLGLVVIDEGGAEIRKIGDFGSESETSNTVERVVEFKEASKDKASPIGMLRLTYSENRLQQETADRRFFSGVMALLLLLTTVVSALVALRYTIKTPLNRILASITLTREKNIHKPIRWNTTDEIGTVVSAYNELQKSQQEYEKELRSIQDDLEQRVVERTRELVDREKDLVSARDNAEQALERLKGTQARLVQSEKMASLGQLTAGIAHEIKNPLNFVNNFAKISKELLEELTDHVRKNLKSMNDDDREDAEDLADTLTGNLTKIADHGQRADSIVKNMLAHSREGPGKSELVDINKLAEEASGLVYHAARAENPGFNITIEKNFDESLTKCECYSQDILRVLINIMSNGMYASHKRHGSGTTNSEPELKIATFNEKGQVRIEITDNGDGIEPEMQEKIFTPFFTTKPAGEGTGLGLSLSFDIVVVQHNGQMKVESQPGEFTTFIVILPNTLSEEDTLSRAE